MYEIILTPEIAGDTVLSLTISADANGFHRAVAMDAVGRPGFSQLRIAPPGAGRGSSLMEAVR